LWGIDLRQSHVTGAILLKKLHMTNDVRHRVNRPAKASKKGVEEETELKGYRADFELGSRVEAAILRSKRLIEQSQDLSRQCNELMNSLRR
jgi:hypothetical protein